MQRKTLSKNNFTIPLLTCLSIMIGALLVLPCAAYAADEGGLAVGALNDSGPLATTSIDGDGSKAVQVAANGIYAAALLDNGSVWTWGAGSKPTRAFDGAVQVAAGQQYYAAIKSDGSLWMWGANGSGQLGDGTTTDRAKPVKVMDDVKQVSLGIGHSAAIKDDGSLWAWGQNVEAGQVGDGTKTNRTRPVKIMDGASQVSLAGWSSAAVKADGSLWLWGYTGSISKSTVPAKVLDGVAQVSVGTVIVEYCFIKGDGALWTLRESDNIANREDPVWVMDGASLVRRGLTHAAAIKDDGSLWTWGRNHRGQLGDGTLTDRDAPVRVTSGVVSVAVGGQQYNIAGSEFTLAVKDDGSIWSWGANGSGQLGDDTESYRATPACIFRSGKWLNAGDRDERVMHRLYNPYSYEHFYTSSADELAGLAEIGWVDEGPGWTAPTTGDPVYRVYNPYNGGDHHYTMSAGERDALVAAGWVDEGVGWFSDPTRAVPVYREYNPNEFVRNHNYTADKGEHDGLVVLGWADEGIAWYGV